MHKKMFVFNWNLKQRDMNIKLREILIHKNSYLSVKVIFYKKLNY